MADALLEGTDRRTGKTTNLQVRLLRRCYSYLSPLPFYIAMSLLGPYHNTPLKFDVSRRPRLASDGPPILRNIDSGRRPKETVKRSCAICHPTCVTLQTRMLVIFVLLLPLQGYLIFLVLTGPPVEEFRKLSGRFSSGGMRTISAGSIPVSEAP